MSTLREQLVHAYGFLQERTPWLPRSTSELYGQLLSKFTGLVSLPIPLVSFLALPFFGGSSATVNLVVFYLTWSALVASHGPLELELYGTLLVRLVCFLLPALGFAAFDCMLPSLAKGLKNSGEKGLPLQLGRKKLLEIAGIAVLNVLLSIAVQAGIETLATQVLHLRSLLKVTLMVPLPWTILKDVAKGFAARGILRYVAHRYLLHTYRTPLRTWHRQWQHSVQLPFSLVAAYDHPLNYLLSQWAPLFLPAVWFRFHVLTWHVLVALVSLEDLFVYSGYAVLPTSIMLAGMARRTDAHFAAVKDGREVGNFGNLGILDLVCRTACKEEANVVDDMQSEAENYALQQRVEKAVQSAMGGLNEEQERRNQASTKAVKGKNVPDHEGYDDVGETRTTSDEGVDGDANTRVGADRNDDEYQPPPTQRRSNRQRARKA
ncbi:hypothetical protein LTR08_002305 [Meristemomyces frigidus]|nr:hypothetical protein LTR08_002305 [Meristemomyces frigidus]